jgi:hypothetical protein
MTIVLVGAAAVFLANVFRQAKNEREQAERRSNLPPRRRDSNTERFLEEVNRRRQEAGGQSKAPPPVRPIILNPFPSATPRREPAVRKIIPKTEKPRPNRPKSRPISAPESIGRLLEVVPADKPLESVPTSPEPSKFPETATPIHRPSTAQVIARPVSLVFQQILPFLRSRQSLRAGFVLHEILGAPRCRRRK